MLITWYSAYKQGLPSCTLLLTNPDQKIICFSYCFSCFRAQKSQTWTIISEPAGLVWTWSECLSHRWNSWQLSTVSQLTTQRVRVYCAVWPSKSQCVCVCVCLWYLRDMSRTETLHHCHPIYMHTLFPFKHAPTYTANFSFIRFCSFYTVTQIHNCVCVNYVSDNNHPITFHYCQHLLFVTWQKFN